MKKENLNFVKLTKFACVRAPIKVYRRLNFACSVY